MNKFLKSLLSLCLFVSSASHANKEVPKDLNMDQIHRSVAKLNSLSSSFSSTMSSEQKQKIFNEVRKTFTEITGEEANIRNQDIEKAFKKHPQIQMSELSTTDKIAIGISICSIMLSLVTCVSKSRAETVTKPIVPIEAPVSPGTTK